MGKRAFTAAERWAVWTVHGEKCYLDGHPVDLLSMQVDHIIPESIADDSQRLAEVLKEFGLPETFELNSYENWMPACGKHNNLKRAMVFKPSPLIQVHLQNAAKKAKKARRIEEQSIKNKEIAKAHNILSREAETLGISDEDLAFFLGKLLEARGTQRKIVTHKPMILPAPRASDFRIYKRFYTLLGLTGVASAGVAVAIGWQAIAILLFSAALFGVGAIMIFAATRKTLKRKVGLDEGKESRTFSTPRNEKSDIRLTPTMSISPERARELIRSARHR